jgi:CBS domain-containing protein
MTTIRDLLADKGETVWSISPDASVYDAIKMMADKEVGALLVMEDTRLEGIISERDYTRKVILLGRSSKDTPVREIMTDQVMYVRPEQTVDESMALMAEKHIRHLPVLVGDRPVGVVSMRDLVQSSISDKELLIEDLERYITGGR